MRFDMTSRGALLALSYLLSDVAGAATITRVARQAETTDTAQLIGFFLNSGTYESWDCRPGSAWQTYGTIGRCCKTATPDCFMATTCISGSIMAGAEFSSTCTGSKAQTSCVTGTIYRTLGDEDPVMNYQCWPEWSGGNWEAVRTTTEGSTTNTPAATASTGSSPSNTAASATASSTSSSSESNSNQQQPEEEKSQAWIAGPVIGGVAAVSIIAGLAFWLRRKKAKRAEAGTVGMSAGEVKMPEYSERYAFVNGHGGNPPGYTNDPVEVSSQTVHEIGGGGGTFEVDGTSVDRRNERK